MRLYRVLLTTLIVIFALCQSSWGAIYCSNTSGVITSIPTLAAASTGASYANREIHITSEYSGTTITFPADRKVVLDSGGVLNYSGTVTFLGGFEADLSLHFKGAGDVVFTAGKITKAHLEWYISDASDSGPALLKAAKSANAAGVPVSLTGATYTMSPVSFQGLSGVHIKGAGNGNGQPYSKITQINFVGSSGIGLQFSDTTNPTPAWISAGGRIEDLYLNGGGTRSGGYWESGGITTAINYSRGTLLKNVTARDFSGNAIVREDYCDTNIGGLENVEGSYSGGHGLLVKGGMSTIGGINGFVGTNNLGYGAVILGGSGSVVHNRITVQGNKIGGLKVYKEAANSATRLGPSDIVFDQFYSEGNGLIGAGQPGYEGDYALVIDSYDTTSSSAACPIDITFRNSAINKSVSGKYANINRVYGLTFQDTNISSFEIGVTAIFGQYAYAITNNAGHFVPTGDLSSASNHLLSITHNAGFPKGVLVNGLWLPKRGRTSVFTFTLPTIAAGATVLMDTEVSKVFSNLSKCQKFFGAGSILGINVYKYSLGGSPSGTLTIRPLYATAAAGYLTVPGNAFTGFTSIVVDTATTLNSKTEYAVGTYNVAEMGGIGIEVTASAGYVNATRPEIIVEVFVEF